LVCENLRYRVRLDPDDKIVMTRVEMDTRDKGPAAGLKTSCGPPKSPYATASPTALIP
jgi:hypothetical protein